MASGKPVLQKHWVSGTKFNATLSQSLAMDVQPFLNEFLTSNKLITFVLLFSDEIRPRTSIILPRTSCPGMKEPCKSNLISGSRVLGNVDRFFNVALEVSLGLLVDPDSGDATDPGRVGAGPGSGWESPSPAQVDQSLCHQSADDWNWDVGQNCHVLAAAGSWWVEIIWSSSPRWLKNFSC